MAKNITTTIHGVKSVKVKKLTVLEHQWTTYMRTIEVETEECGTILIDLFGEHRLTVEEVSNG